MSTLKYLTTYAEPECACEPPPGTFSHGVVIPAFDEEPSFLRRVWPRAKVGRPLWIVVANASEDRSAKEITRTREMHYALATGGRSLAPGIVHISHDVGELVVVDRVSEGRLLPAKQGVGLARKIGCDLLLAWHGRKAVESPWLHTTDADARLPRDYFSASDSAIPRDDVAALSYPFWHDVEVTSPRGRALELYELSLRYYVLGLSWASSPYAFHSIGSTMAVRAEAYASVRGVPRRLAGEDFYLLNKVAKEGAVITPASRPVRLSERSSSRTPFGTGPATSKNFERLKAGQPIPFYNPKSFALLLEWQDALMAYADNGDISFLEAFSHQELADALPLDTAEQLERSTRETRSKAALKRRLLRWFDGFQTLKLIHRLRDLGLRDLPWEEAVEMAPFVPEPLEGTSLRQAMARREAERLKS